MYAFEPRRPTDAAVYKVCAHTTYLGQDVGSDPLFRNGDIVGSIEVLELGSGVSALGISAVGADDGLLQLGTILSLGVDLNLL